MILCCECNASITNISSSRRYTGCVHDDASYGCLLLLVHSSSSRKDSQPKPANIDPNPNTNPGVLDGWEALHAFLDAENSKEKFEEGKNGWKEGQDGSCSRNTQTKKSTHLPQGRPPTCQILKILHHWHLQQKSTPEKGISASKDAEGHDPEDDNTEDADPEEIACAFTTTPGQQLVSTTTVEGQTRVYLSVHISSDLQSSRLFFPHL